MRDTGFHDGELAVQRRAGVQQQAARLSAMVGPGELRGGVPGFLAKTTFAALTARDGAGRLWTSPLVGAPGFLNVDSPATLSIRNPPRAGDPLHDVPAGQAVGLVVIDFATRRRVRVNGTLSGAGGQLAIEVAQAYGNCPQYIHPRHVGGEESSDTRAVRVGTTLSADDVAQLTAADTFFLGTTHPEFGNDASHRGGPPGFLAATADTVVWPDYPGNNMFNSLGNIAVDPAAALLFVDFDSGRTTQVSGKATLHWRDDQRAVRLDVERVVTSTSAALRQTAAAV